MLALICTLLAALPEAIGFDVSSSLGFLRFGGPSFLFWSNASEPGRCDRSRHFLL
jgi:hypothetical protein